MLTIKDLTFSYNRKRKILDDFSLDLYPGGIYGLLGPNGAGKTTLLLLAAGCLKPQRGCVEFDGRNVCNHLPSVSNRIFLVPEEVSLPEVSIEEYIARNSPFYPNFSKAVFDECLEMFDFKPSGKLNALSMGQRKKVLLSFSFACRPNIILMDEPTNGLDIPGKTAFRKIAARMTTDDMTLLISTHQIRDLDLILDHVIIMNDTQLLLSASVSEILDRLSFASGLETLSSLPVLESSERPGGFDVMMAVAPGLQMPETDVNLELLFNYSLKNPAKIKEIFSDL